MISEDDFRSVWRVRTAPNGDFFEFDDVSKHSLNRVWTVVETGDDRDGNWYALPGYHIVNKIGYVLTEKPWNDNTADAIYFLDDMEADEDGCFPESSPLTSDAGLAT